MDLIVGQQISRYFLRKATYNLKFGFEIRNSLIDFRRNPGHIVPYIAMDSSVIQRSDNAKILGILC